MVPWRPEPAVISRTWDTDETEQPVQALPSILSLNSELPPDLLRAVALDTCLAGFARHWCSAGSSTDLQCSECTKEIDAFLSHDWQTGAIGKYLSLLLIFNAVPAALVAVVVSIVTCSLLAWESLPGGWPAATVSIYASFLLVMFFKQRLTRFLGCRPKNVFLDKLCIAQQDEQRKKQGILGLAGFLNSSKELIILWSPKTFGRLWCTFELACFLRNAVPKPIHFVPVSMAKLLWLAGLNNLCLWLLWLVWVTIEIEGALGTSSLGVLLLALVILGPAFLLGIGLQTYFGIQHMAEFLHLHQQLSAFSVRSAQCACCNMEHRLQGRRILCDRQQIFATLKRWFHEDASHPEYHLDRFDALVQKQLAPAVRKALGAGTAPLRYVLAMLVVPPLTLLPPYLHMGIHEIRVKRLRYDGSEWWNLWQWMCMAIHIPAIALWIFWLSMNSWKVASWGVFSRFKVCTKVLFLIVLQIFAIGCAWGAFSYATFPKLPERLIPVTLALWLLVLISYALTYLRG